MSNLGAQTQEPEQTLTSLMIIAPIFVQLPTHGTSSGV